MFRSFRLYRSTCALEICSLLLAGWSGLGTGSRDEWRMKAGSSGDDECEGMVTGEDSCLRLFLSFVNARREERENGFGKGTI